MSGFDTKSGTPSDTAVTDCRRDVETAVMKLDGVDPVDVHEAASSGVDTVVVPEAHARSVFELTGVDCAVCAGLVEAALARLDGVSNATTSHHHGTVSVDYDSDVVTPATLRAELSTLGYPVETTDEAFANRRGRQWADARLATGVMAGLMAFAPYAGVIYPTRYDWLIHEPAVVALLERALDSIAATHFFLNIAVLTALVLLFTGKPILNEAGSAVRARSPSRPLALATVLVGVFAYSTATAFVPWIDGGVYYDVVILLVVGATLVRRSDAPVDATTPTPDPTRPGDATTRPAANGGTGDRSGVTDD